MKIVHVESGRHLYGGAQQVRYLIDGLGRRGIENVLLCPPGAAVARAVETARVIELPMNGDLDLGLLRRLRRVFTALRPDLVHVHSRRGADLYGGLACAGAPWPVVLTRRVDSREWAPWARLKYSRYAAVVAISRAIERELVGRVGVARRRVHRVASGVDPERFRPDPLARKRVVDTFELPANAIVVGVVAQLIARKGHAALLGCLPELVRRHERVRVLLFGRGPLERRLRHDIESRDLGAHVNLVGSRDDLAQLLPGFDVVAHPARAEGMGVAVLEALSAGVPVVASAAGGIVDVIEDGRQGLLVPPDDRLAWTRALERLVADPAERRRMGGAGRRRVEQYFTASRMTDGNLDVYRTVLQRSVAG